MPVFLKNVLPPTREHNFRGSPRPQIAHERMLFVRSPPGTLRKHAFSTFCRFSASSWHPKELQIRFWVLRKMCTFTLVGTISTPCWTQWLLEPQMVTNVPPQTYKFDVLARITTSKFHYIADDFNVTWMRKIGVHSHPLSPNWGAFL